MSRLARSCGALVVGIAAAAAMLSTTPVASAAQEGPTVPGAIAVPAGNKVFLFGRATGVQIYACNNGTWGPTSTPRATLVDDKGKVVATHFGGPTWQARDGSTVVGSLPPKASAPSPKGSIEWLLLTPKSTAPGPDGDKLAKTTFIQRVNTTGGLAPTTNCKTGDDPVEIPYTADYYFWKATGSA
jgi:hypothetical protein